MKQVINIATLLGADLRHRSFFRRDIERILPGMSADSIALNFEGVRFISRSVADEVYNILEDYPRLRVENMSGDVDAMYAIVVRGRQTPRVRSTGTIRVIRMKSKVELSAFLGTL